MAVIGSLLLWGTESNERLIPVATFLRPQDFFREKNGWIYEAMLALLRAGGVVDQLTVAHWLAEHDKLEAIGGPAYLIACLAEVPTSMHLDYYAHIVRDLADRRRRINKAGAEAAAAYNGDDSTPLRGVDIG